MPPLSGHPEEIDAWVARGASDCTPYLEVGAKDGRARNLAATCAFERSKIGPVRIGVTYTHDGRKWLAIADQGTQLP